LLKELGFSLQANAKTREGTSHPDRNAQFEHINAKVKAFQTAGDPVISVDTKKKEPIVPRTPDAAGATAGCSPSPGAALKTAGA